MSPRTTRRALAAAAVVALMPLVGCGLLSSAEFDEGDWVMAQSGVFNDDLDPGDCTKPVEPLSSDGVPYRVGAVLDGTGASCSSALEEWEVEFSHEPDGVTYCLVGRTVVVSSLRRLDRESSVDEDTSDPAADDFTGDGAPPECIEAAIAEEPPPDGCEGYGLSYP